MPSSTSSSSSSSIFHLILLLTTVSSWLPTEQVCVTGQQIATSSSVRVDQSCYNQGVDTSIGVRFEDVVGTGVFVGLYQEEKITNFSMLPEFNTGALSDWTLTCGTRNSTSSECTEWPTRGIVHFPITTLASGSYLVAVSGDQASLTPQAISFSFLVGDCVPSVAPSLPPSSTPSMPPSGMPSVVEIPVGVPRMVSTSFMDPVIADLRSQVGAIISSDQSMIGKFLRLVFHDCVGGCDGCVDMTNPDNAGLEAPIQILQPLVAQFGQSGLTRTDVWMVSSLVATEMALPEPNRGAIAFPLKWMGRKTCEMVNSDCGVDFNGQPTVCTSLRGPHVNLCHGSSGTQTIQTFFADEFGFDAQQITALMGAHSLGKMSVGNSGFDGQWDLSPHSLDIGYMIELERGPDFILTSKENGKQQWEGRIEELDLTIVMLQADIALVREIPDEPDDTDCTFRGGDNPCSTETPFIDHVRRYLTDSVGFLNDFRDVLNLLIDHGHDKSGLGGDCPEGSLCSFGFEPPGFVRPPGFVTSGGSSSTTTMVLVPPSAAPVPPAPVAQPSGSTAATLTVDKTCYTLGETISAVFSNVVGTGVWIGIYEREDVVDFTSLPHMDTGLLIDWILICQRRDNCDEWPTSGAVQLPSTFLTTPNDYMLVVSGDGGSQVGQAASFFSTGC